MNDKLISKLTKGEILQLPGMGQHRTRTIKELREIVKNNIINDFHQRTATGFRFSDYLKFYRRQDNQLFRQIKQNKRNLKQKEAQKVQYKKNLKEKALNERQFEPFMNMSTDIYANIKNKLRLEYENRLKEISNITVFKKELKQMIKNISNCYSFELNIGDNEIKRVAFTKALRETEIQ